MNTKWAEIMFDEIKDDQMFEMKTNEISSSMVNISFKYQKFLLIEYN